MSIYHTIADVEAKLKGMVSNTSSIITPTVFQQMCDRTEAVVTERFARKFAVPFDAIHPPQTRKGLASASPPAGVQDHNRSPAPVQ